MISTKNIPLLSVLCALVLMSSCRLFEQTKSEASLKPSFVIVNVLDKEFYDDCHIKGSINVPFEKLESYAIANWDKDTTEIVIHCTNYKCTASAAGWQMLHGLGFKKIFAYEGGTAEARHVGIPVEGPCKENYLQDYEKSSSMSEQKNDDEPSVVIISAEDLKKKLEEFAVKA